VRTEPKIVPEINISLELPYFLRFEKPMNLAYDAVCQERPVAEFEGRDLRVSFTSHEAKNSDRSEIGFHLRTTINVQISCDATPSDDSISTFAILNTRELVNRIVNAYQATTGEVENAGFISPIGTSYVQLFAEIFLDGEDVRDRWPGRNGTNFPLSSDEVDRIEEYVTGEKSLPISSLLLTNGSLLAEQGQYSLAVFLAAAAGESQLTAYVAERMEQKEISRRRIAFYQRKPLGYKLGRQQGEADSIETYFDGNDGYSDLHCRLKDRLNTRLRIPVVHHGYIATREDALEANNLARQFFRILA
jgi:hypothetical protein